MKKTLSLLTVLLMAFVFVACGSNSSKYEGKYAITEFTYGTMSYKEGDELWSTIMGGKEFYIELKAGNKCTVNFSGETEDGEYEVNGEEITLKDSKEELKGTFKDNKITLDVEGMKMVFAKK